MVVQNLWELPVSDWCNLRSRPQGHSPCLKLLLWPETRSCIDQRLRIEPSTTGTRKEKSMIWLLLLLLLMIFFYRLVPSPIIIRRLPPTAKRSNIGTHSQTLGGTRGPQEGGEGRIIGANGEKDIGENSPHSQQRRTHRDSQRRKWQSPGLPGSELHLLHMLYIFMTV